MEHQWTISAAHMSSANFRRAMTLRQPAIAQQPYRLLMISLRIFELQHLAAKPSSPGNRMNATSIGGSVSSQAPLRDRDTSSTWLQERPKLVCLSSVPSPAGAWQFGRHILCTQ